MKLLLQLVFNLTINSSAKVFFLTFITASDVYFSFYYFFSGNLKFFKSGHSSIIILKTHISLVKLILHYFIYLFFPANKILKTF